MVIVVISGQVLYFVTLALVYCNVENGIGTQCSTMQGPVRELCRCSISESACTNEPTGEDRC